MALNSPGVEVTIIDQSQYLPSAPNSVPLILVATAQNKATPAGTAVAPGTTAANANKLYAVTSQRDLVNLFGTPFFYKTTNGTPIQGYELNEYGLQTAYSILGSTNLVYILRADVDLAALIGTTGRPAGEPATGTYWLDTTNTGWGINEFNSSTGIFSRKNPIVLVDPADVINTNSGEPQQYIGNIGDYAVSENYNIGGNPPTARSDMAQPNTYSSYWYKTGAYLDPLYDADQYNLWVKLGSPEWYAAVPAVIGDLFSAIPIGGPLSFAVTYNLGGVPTTVTSSFNLTAGWNISQVSSAINADNVPFVSSNYLNGRIQLFFGPEVISVEITNSPAGSGIAGGRTYYPIGIAYGTNSQMPLWTTNSTTPRGTGSVWIQTNTSGGLVPNLQVYNSAAGSWSNVPVGVSTADWVYTNAIDAAGGLNIPSGSVYAQVNGNGTPFSPIQLWKRSASGPAIFTGGTLISNMGFAPSTTYSFNVFVSTPGISTLSSPYTVSFTTTTELTGQAAADRFVRAFQAAMIPNTEASSAGSYITLTHTAGGVIVLDDTPTTGTGTLVGVTVTGATGQCECSAVPANQPLTIGQTVIVSGVSSGSIPNGTYTITDTNGSTTFTLNASVTTPGITAGQIFTYTYPVSQSPLTGTNGAGFYLPNNVPTGLTSISSAKFGPYKLLTSGVLDTTTEGGGSGATVILTAEGYELDSVTIVNGGSGYATNDFITVEYLGATFLFGVLAPAGEIVELYWAGYPDDDPARPTPQYTTLLSNWQVFGYIPNEIAVTVYPANDTYWYYSTATQIDIMTNLAAINATFTGSITGTTLTVTNITSGSIVVGMTISWTGGNTATIIAGAGSTWTLAASATATTGTIFNGVAGASWVGYLNTRYGTNGLPASSGGNTTYNGGPIVAATEPSAQPDGTPLQYGDIWIDSNDLENYPVMYRWQLLNGVNQWVLIDTADQTTENGIVFADARWGSNGDIDPIDDPIPSISSLLTSNYLDLDAPDPSLYPQGTLLFNTRRSGYNVKQFKLNYFNSRSFPDRIIPQETSTWVSVSGLKPNGQPYMGRKAQRNLIVQALKSAIDTNTEIREEDTFINLLATPNYPELQPNMVTLNNDRNQTAYVIGDTPLRLAANATDILAWATNAAGATQTGEDGLVTRDTYMGLYYPSAIASDLTGAQVVMPSSYMMMKTMLFNDTVAYPWFAPAGQRRGIVSNATNIGYLDATSGEFITDKNRMSLRDVEYLQYINPIAFFTNVGILNYGNKNSFDSQSALDRTNVARLICYLRYQLQRAVRPFLFEPNTAFTRSQVRSVVESLMIDIQAKSGIYDYLVVCDSSNNTPARIDRSELWCDVAIEPVKAVEFIYIPVRILNTGEIAGLGAAA